MIMEVPNRQLAGVQGQHVVVLAPRTVMSKKDALVHAAWLVALADESEGHSEFLQALNAVLQT